MESQQMTGAASREAKSESRKVVGEKKTAKAMEK